MGGPAHRPGQIPRRPDAVLVGLLPGITDLALLRASHIIPWADCETDAERLDVGNGLLLSSLWDAAFDAHLVSFADDGRPVAATGLTAKAKDALGFAGANPIGTFTLGHRARLAAHRARTLMTRDGASTA